MLKIIALSLLAINFGLMAQDVSNYKEISIHCYTFEGQSTLICTEDEYNSLELNHLRVKSYCRKYKQPKIDFQTYALAGFKVVLGGCSEPEVKEIYYYDADSIHFKLKIHEMGGCSALRYVDKWFLIEKKVNCNQIQLDVELIESKTLFVE